MLHPLLALVSVVLPAFAVAPQDAKAPAVDPAKQKALDDVAAAIQADIERLRGEQFKHSVPVKLADKATLIEYLSAREALETKPEREVFKEECAKLLGLVPATMDVKAATHAFLQSQVGGFYDPPTKTFYVMDSFDGELARVIMSHEFVHALDDQLYDLDGTAKKLGDDTDQLLAFWSVCEGSGTYTMTQWMIANAAKLDRESLMEFQKLGVAGMEDLPPMIWKPMLAAYTCGQTFVDKSTPKKKRAKKGEDAPATPADEKPAPTYVAQLARAFRAPPRSTEQVLHPEKYWDPEQKDEPKRITFDASAPPAGWRVLGEDTLGELGLALLTTPLAERKGIDGNDLMALATLTYTNKAAKGWGGDRLILLGRGDDRLLQLVTVWDTEADAKEFHAAVEGVLPLADAASSAPRLVPVRKSVATRAEDPQSVVIELAWARDPKSLPDAAVAGLAWSVK
ncbi:MAG: hypothetical protein HZA53_19525 [Planctomycetes bacterium]|nr:hypothetical protein [Planctomycetota bacterium]